jgi:hypothetical protein
VAAAFARAARRSRYRSRLTERPEALASSAMPGVQPRAPSPNRYRSRLTRQAAVLTPSTAAQPPAPAPQPRAPSPLVCIHRLDELFGLDNRLIEIGNQRIDVDLDSDQLGVDGANRLGVEIVLEEQHAVAQR